MILASVGDVALRRFGGPADRVPPMRLKVSAVTHDRIVCGPWAFDRKTGAEIDDELGWGPAYGRSGSFLIGIDKNTT